MADSAPSKDVKKEYSRPGVASGYDEKRFACPSGRRRNLRKIAAIRKALALIDKPRLILDLPCGTGRLFEFFTEEGFRFVGADIAQPMLKEAAAKNLSQNPLRRPEAEREGGVQGATTTQCGGKALWRRSNEARRLRSRPKSGWGSEIDSMPQSRPAVGLVAADGEALPFKDGVFDVVFSIRFLFHLTPEQRVRIIREMARVTRGHLVLDYRLRYSLKNVVRLALHKLGLKKRLRRVTRGEMLSELNAAGVEPLAIFPVTRFFSDKHVVLCRPVRAPLGAHKS
jgi:ubiquinone/menaquinone biosynthesis C-methylase UbiE